MLNIGVIVGVKNENKINNRIIIEKKNANKTNLKRKMGVTLIPTHLHI